MMDGDVDVIFKNSKINSFNLVGPIKRNGQETGDRPTCQVSSLLFLLSFCRFGSVFVSILTITAIAFQVIID